MQHHCRMRVLGLLGFLAIIAASLVPGPWRPHSGAPKGLEHLWAYALCAAILAVGFPGLRQAALIATSLVAASGLLEIGQHWVVGRTPSVGDFMLSSAGALIGLLAGSCACRLLAMRNAAMLPATRSDKLQS
jgi:VanZ family protein